jgi:hypothetical protein
MEERLKLSRDNTAEEVNSTHYWRLIANLRYLVNTLPNIAFVVGYMSRFMERPTMEHLQTVKRILHYVAGTLNYGLHYARAPDTARGTMFFLDDCLVSCQSLKQKVVALSSCEAEYIAATTAGKSKFQGMRERIGLQQITSKA